MVFFLYLRSLPGFFKVGVPQGCFCGDAFIGVICEHLIEQRQSRGRAVGDQSGDTRAFFGREVEVYRFRPARQEETMRILLFQILCMLLKPQHKLFKQHFLRR